MDAGPLATQAVILAGGQGTRLRPLTLARAKPVVPLLNRPFLAYQIALLREHGVRDVILSCSYRVDDVRQALGDAHELGVRLRYVVEAEPLGTGGGVRNAADLARGTVFVLNGDVLTDADLTAMLAFHEARSSRVTIFLIWIFSNHVQQAFNGNWIAPLAGLILLPYTTLMYILVYWFMNGVNGFGWAFVILGLFLDISAYAAAGQNRRVAAQSS